MAMIKAPKLHGPDFPVSQRVHIPIPYGPYTPPRLRPLHTLDRRPSYPYGMQIPGLWRDLGAVDTQRLHKALPYTTWALKGLPSQGCQEYRYYT